MKEIASGKRPEANAMIKRISRLRRRVQARGSTNCDWGKHLLPTALSSLPPADLQPSNLANKTTLQRVVAAAGSDTISVTRLTKDRIRCDAHALQQALKVLPAREAYRTISSQLGAKSSKQQAIAMVDREDGTRTTNAQEAVDAHAAYYSSSAATATANTVDTSTAEGLSRFIDVLGPCMPTSPRIRMLVTDDAAEDRISTAIKQLKSGKATGPSGVPTRAVRLTFDFDNGERKFPDVLLKALQAIHNCAMACGQYPLALLRTFIAPAFKGKPDDRDCRCSDYRCIQYADVIAKVLGIILLGNCQEVMAQRETKGASQFGFTLRRDRIIAILKILQQIFTAGTQGLVLLFGDLKAAFDRVQWPIMRFTLEKAGLSATASSAFVSRMKAKAEVYHRPSNTRSEPFERGKGTCQGDPISPDGFAVSMVPANEYVRRACAGPQAAPLTADWDIAQQEP